MEFSRQEYWSGLLFPSLGDLPDAGIEPESSALQANSLLSEPPTLEVKVESFIHQGAVKSWALAVSRYNWTELSESTVLELERQPLWTGNIRRRRLKCQSYTGTLLVISPLKCTKGENILNTVFFLFVCFILIGWNECFLVQESEFISSRSHWIPHQEEVYHELLTLYFSLGKENNWQETFILHYIAYNRYAGCFM